MKLKSTQVGIPGMLGAVSLAAYQAQAVTEMVTPLPSWHATSLPQAVGQMALFVGIGIVLAIVGFKVFDFFTPGDLQKEIIENKNLAAAVVAASVILGVCLIIAASMLG